MILVILSLLIIWLIYFLSMVCIQFNYINNISLQLGMDVTKLYSDNEDENFSGNINNLIRNTAMVLYKISHHKLK